MKLSLCTALVGASALALIAFAAAALAGDAPCTSGNCTAAASPDHWGANTAPDLSTTGWGGPGRGHGPVDENGNDVAPPADDPAGDNTTASIAPRTTGSTVTQWFDQLSSGDQTKFLAEAAKQGLVDPEGNAFSSDQFAAMSIFFDEELTRQGYNDADKLKVLGMMAEEAGFAAPAPSATQNPAPAAFDAGVDTAK